jgi:hypothetical protein
MPDPEVINKQLDHKKVPKEIAVFVDDLDGGYHHVIIGADQKHYLVHEDELTLPEISTICILIPSYELPTWARHGEEISEMSERTYALDGTIETFTTWKIKKG